MNSESQGPRFPQPGRTPAEDTAAVMKFYKLPTSFPREVLEEAEKVKDLRRETEDARRLDLRKKFIFTCDPVTARDYDDALSLETDRKGNRILGVHIADVSHYVRPGSAIAREDTAAVMKFYKLPKAFPREVLEEAARVKDLRLETGDATAGLRGDELEPRPSPCRALRSTRRSAGSGASPPRRPCRRAGPRSDTARS